MNYLVIGFLAGLTVGIVLAIKENPYDRCSTMYTAPEDIIECLWILENN